MAESAREADWKLIEAQLPLGWRELAAEMKLARPAPPHVQQKIVDIATALRLVLHYVAQRGSQRATIAAAAAAGIVVMSQVAFFKWMRKIGRYLEALVAGMVEPDVYASSRWGGYALIAADATTVQRPGAKGTTARIHYGLHLLDLRPRFIRITDATVGETMRNFDPEAGELWIVDRGYANPPSVEFVLDRGADILVRHHRTSLPLFDVHGERIDVSALISGTVERSRPTERKVYLRAAGGRMLALRLCWVRLAEVDAAKARERVRREGVVDPADVDAAECIVLVTTAPRARLDTEQILALYRARWQVELDFKRDKSIGQLDTLPSLIPETIHAWLCAKVLLGLIARRLASQEVCVPPSGIAAAIFPLVAGSAPEPRARRRALVRDAAGLGHSPRRPATHQAV